MMIDVNEMFMNDKSRISRYVVFALCFCFHFSRVVDSLKFAKAKSRDVKQVGDHTKNVVFDWEYIMEPGDTIQSIRIGYHVNGNQFSFAFKKFGEPLVINSAASSKDKDNIKVEIDDKSVARLTLKQVISTLDNDRKFFCLITHRNGRLLAEVLLEVYVPPVFTKKSSTLTKIKEGTTLTLQCQATAEPRPMIKWEAYNKTKVVSFNDVTGLLAIQAVDRTDSGNYTCTASNVGGNISYTVTVEVQYAPEMDLNRSTKVIGTYVSNPKPINLKCIADGVPPPKYIWNNPQGFEIQMASHIHVIQDPEQSDIGKYTCKAVNDVGTAWHTIQVIGIKAPGAVVLTRTALSSRSARFAFQLPTDLGNSVLKETKLSYRPLTGDTTKIEKFLLPDQKMFDLKDLKPFTLYEVNVTIKNEFFESDGQKYNFKTKEDRPGPPFNVTMVGTVSSMTATWLPPKEPNGVLLNYFYIFSKSTDIGNATEVKIGPTIGKKVFDNLDFYTQYTFKIKAATKIATGNWAPEIKKYTDPNAPSKPLNITVTIERNNFIGVRWRPPADRGGGRITKYHIKINMTSKENPAIVNKATRPYLFDAPSDQNRFYRLILVPYVKGNLWIREGGGEKPIWGEFGGPVSFEMPEGAPTKPLNVKVLAVTSDKIHLTWKRPIQINGILQNFTVQFNKKGENTKHRRYVTKQLDNTTFYYTINQLDALSLYEVQIYALSNAAMSDPSDMAVAKTEKSLVITNSPATADDESTSLVPIIGGVVAFVFLMVVGVALFLYLSRRRSRLKHTSSNSSEAGFIKLNDAKIELNGISRSNPSLFVSDFGSESGKTSHRLFELIRPIQLTSLKKFITSQSENHSKGFIDEFRSIKPEGDFTFDVSTKPENKVKNRYANILAYDHSRVVLNTVENLDNSDYINANYVDGYDKTSKFIATQGPVSAAFGDFWRMVWEQNTTTIVMITNLMEKGRSKCQRYWPNDGESGQEYGNIKVSTLDENELADYIIRRFTITFMKNGDEVSSRKVTQYQFISWPDHGCPQIPSQLLQFTKRIRSIPQNDGPIVLHCSAGVGRTGTYMTIDAMLDQIEKEQVIDVFGYVTHIRSQRNLLVQTEPQYIFIYKTVLESISCGNTDMNAMDLPAKIKHLNAINPGTTQTYMQEEYQRLSTNLETLEDYEAAMLPCNTVKNRFPDIIPFETARVKLWPYPDIEGSDYINASFVDGYQQREAYILTQAPQENTIQDFWRMLWEYEVFSVVMISSAGERDMHHCYPYWPVNNEPTMFGLLRVQICEEEEKHGYVKRQFKVTNTKSGEHRSISHFMYFDWPVHGTPDPPSVIELIGQLQKTQQMTGNSSVVIHCSDGSGRSGAFAALMYCIERVKLEGLVDVFQTVRTMRTHRTSIVQSLEQYQFIYNAVCNYLDCFSNYSNFK